MGSGFSKMKKQARLMQDQYEKMREETQNKQVTGNSGNGLVTITLNGEHQMLSITIKPDCVDPNDVEGLQDLIKAAYTNALSQLQKEGSDLEKMMGPLPFSF